MISFLLEYTKSGPLLVHLWKSSAHSEHWHLCTPNHTHRFTNIKHNQLQKGFSVDSYWEGTLLIYDMKHLFCESWLYYSISHVLVFTWTLTTKYFRELKPKIVHALEIHRETFWTNAFKCNCSENIIDWVRICISFTWKCIYTRNNTYALHFHICIMNH